MKSSGQAEFFPFSLYESIMRRKDREDKTEVLITRVTSMRDRQSPELFGIDTYKIISNCKEIDGVD